MNMEVGEKVLWQALVAIVVFMLMVYICTKWF